MPALTAQVHMVSAGGACVRQTVSVSRAVVTVSGRGRARLAGAERVELGTQLLQRVGCALLEACDAARSTQQNCSLKQGSMCCYV